MSSETARRALEMAFRSPSPHTQDRVPGRRAAPQLRADRADRRRGRGAERREHGKDLVLRDRDEPRAPRRRGARLLRASTTSTSRPRSTARPTSTTGTVPGPGGDSWERAVDGIRRVRETLGVDRVSALMTTTARSLDRSREIIDSYVEQGLTRHLPAAALALRLRGQDQEPTRPTTPSGGSTSTRRASTTSSSSTEQGVADHRALRLDHPEEDADQRRPRLRRSDLARRASGSARSSTTTTATSTPPTRAGCSPRWATRPSGSATSTRTPTRRSCSRTRCSSRWRSRSP